MIIGQKIKEHFTDSENVTIYLLVLGLFFYEWYDEGVRVAVQRVTFIAFLASAWFTVAYIAGSIMARKFTMGASDIVSVMYFLGFITYWIANHGINKKLYLLVALPILTGLIIVLASLFRQSEAYEKLDRAEKGLFKRLFSIYRKKS